LKKTKKKGHTDSCASATYKVAWGNMMMKESAVASSELKLHWCRFPMMYDTSLPYLLSWLEGIAPAQSLLFKRCELAQAPSPQRSDCDGKTMTP